MKKPNVIFSNLNYSGSSGVEPILRDFLASQGYSFPGVGPENTHDLYDVIPDTPTPFYIWTHSPITMFSSLYGRDDYKFVFMHRDPRDVLISWANDILSQQNLPKEKLEALFEAGLHPDSGLLDAFCWAVEWIQCAHPDFCKIITFSEMKTDNLTLMQDIFKFIGFSERQIATSIDELVDKYSFENMTGRKRGEKGPTVRTAYMLRSGSSGNWIKQFDKNLRKLFLEKAGKELNQLGYEQNDDWLDVWPQESP